MPAIMTKVLLTGSLVLGALVHLSGLVLASPQRLSDFTKADHALLDLGNPLPTAKTFRAQDGQTAAGGFLYTYQNGECLTLLGLRDDTADYTSPGGKSETGHGTLSETAAAEIKQETVGVYAPHPHLLAQLPYCDFLRADVLYRLYFLPVPYVKADLLEQRRKVSPQTESQELSSFCWQPLNKLSELKLFKPFQELLAVPAVQAILDTLQKKKPVQFSPWRNQVYKEGTPYLSTPALYRIRWQPVVTGSLATLPVPLGKTASGASQTSVLLMRNQETIRKSDHLLSAHRDQEILGHAVAAHGGAMLALKRLFEKRQSSTSPTLPHTPPQPTISDYHLSLVVPSFQEALRTWNNLSPDQITAATRTACSELLKTPNATFTTNLTDVLTYVRQYPDTPSFFHGGTQEIHHLIRSFTAWHKLLMLDSNEEILSLRGHHVYFQHDPRTLSQDQIMPKFSGMHEKADVICSNPVLTGAHGPSSSTSSSINYWLSSHNACPPQSLSVFEEASALMGMLCDYGHLEGLMHQYVQPSDPTQKNGMMLVLSLSPQLFSSCVWAYPFSGRRSLFSFDELQNKYEAWLQGIRHASQSHAPDDFPECRILLHPEIMKPDLMRMKSFDFFPLGARKAQLDQGFHRTLTAMLGDWLGHHHCIMDGAFLGTAALKNLYRLIFETSTGTPYTEKVSLQGLKYLIKHESFELVADYVARHPEFQVGTIFESLKLGTPGYISVLQKRGYATDITSQVTEKMLQDLIQCMYQWDRKDRDTAVLLQDVIDLKKFKKETQRAFLDECLYLGFDKAVARFFKNIPEGMHAYYEDAELSWVAHLLSGENKLRSVDAKRLSPATRHFLLHNLVRFADTSSLAKLKPLIPQADQRITQLIFALALDANDSAWVQELYTSGVADANAVVREAFRLVEKFPSYKHSSRSRLFVIIANALQSEQVDLRTPLAGDQDPFVFRVAELLDTDWGIGLSDALQKLVFLLHEDLNQNHQKGTAILQLKNRYGHTLIQHLQRLYLKGQRPHWILENFQKNQGSDWLKERVSDPDFVRLVGVNYKMDTHDNNAITCPEDVIWVQEWIQISQHGTIAAKQAHLEKAHHALHHLFKKSCEDLGLKIKRSPELFHKRNRSANQHYQILGTRQKRFADLWQKPQSAPHDIELAWAELSLPTAPYSFAPTGVDNTIGVCFEHNRPDAPKLFFKLLADQLSQYDLSGEKFVQGFWQLTKKHEFLKDWLAQSPLRENMLTTPAFYGYSWVGEQMRQLATYLPETLTYASGLTDRFDHVISNVVRCLEHQQDRDFWVAFLKQNVTCLKRPHPETGIPHLFKLLSDLDRNFYMREVGARVVPFVKKLLEACPELETFQSEDGLGVREWFKLYDISFYYRRLTDQKLMKYKPNPDRQALRHLFGATTRFIDLVAAHCP